MNYYIASCVFTERFPELSEKIRNYVKNNYDMEIVRCCTPGWKVKIHEDRMPEGKLYDEWKDLPQSKVFTLQDAIWSLCPNCMNIAEEWRNATVHSLWEQIDRDPHFPFPDYHGMVVCYCHYCLEGLLTGGINGKHIAELLFAPEKSRRNIQ